MVSERIQRKHAKRKSQIQSVYDDIVKEVVMARTK